MKLNTLNLILICSHLMIISFGCDDGDTDSIETAGAAAGETIAGESTAGESTAGESTAGEITAGETTAGETNAGETTAGEATAGETTAGEITAGEELVEPPCPEGQERVNGVCVPTEIEGSLSQEVIDQMVGVYATQLRMAMIMDVPILGELENISHAFLLTEIRADGMGGLEMIENGCGALSAAGDSIQVEIPAAIPQSIEAPVTTLIVWEDNNVINWSRPQLVATVGVRLEDPVNDPLPTDRNDPRIWDQDEDGQPGVTVRVTGFAAGDLYIIQKQVSSLSGVLNADGNLEGNVVDDSEQVTIGSTNPLLNQQIPSRPNPDRSLSTVRSVKMTDTVDCDWLLSNQADLFPESN